jgi:hypothetical protein
MGNTTLSNVTIHSQDTDTKLYGFVLGFESIAPATAKQSAFDESKCAICAKARQLTENTSPVERHRNIATLCC